MGRFTQNDPIYSILEITTVLYFPLIKHNATKVSADALYSIRKFSFGKVYTAFVGNLLYRVSHKMIPCALIRKLRTLELFDLLTTGRKSLIKQLTVSLHINNRKYKKGDIVQQYIDTLAMSRCVISHFFIFAVSDV